MYVHVVYIHICTYRYMPNDPRIVSTIDTNGNSCEEKSDRLLNDEESLPEPIMCSLMALKMALQRPPRGPKTIEEPKTIKRRSKDHPGSPRRPKRGSP